MAKLSRTALKGLVKECLVEILAEGIGLDSTTNRANIAASPASLNENKKRTAKRMSRRSSTDNMRVQAHNDTLVESLAGTNPVMREIFNDTLKNTMAARPNVDENSSLVQRTVHGDGATKQMLNSDPMSLFDGSSNWESLAFPSTE